MCILLEIARIPKACPQSWCINMARKYKVTFDIYVDENETTNLEYFLQDLLQKSVLPALSAELVPLSMYVTKKRSN